MEGEQEMSENSEQEVPQTLQRGQMDINSPKLNVLLFRMGIAKVTIEDWIVLQHSTFDITVDGEPYSALQLYFNSQNGEYLIRVWGKTHSKGKIAKSMAELELLCSNIFVKGPACCPGQIGNDATESFISIEYPFQRRISPDCTIAHLPEGSNHVPVEICSQCTINTKGKIEFKEEPCDAYVSLLRDPLTFDTGAKADLSKEQFENDTGSTYPIPYDKRVNYVAPFKNENMSWGEGEEISLNKDPSNPEEIPTEPLEEMKVECELQVREDYTKYGIKKRKRNIKNSKMLTCDLCPYTSPNPSGLSRHVKAVHHKLRDHVCTECGYAASQRSDFVVHMVKVHKMDEEHFRCNKPKVNKNPNAPLVSGERKKRGPKGVRTWNPKADAVCPTCGKQGTYSTIYNHMNQHKLEENPLRCPYSRCGALFETAEATKQHINDRHLRKHKLYCEICGLMFAEKSSLKQHVMIVHEKKSMDVKCTECDLIFVTSQEMQRHRIIVHYPDRFRCQECQKSFSTPKELRKHINFHKGIRVRPFKCDQCGRGLKDKTDFDDHMRTHTGEKPYHCQYCSYRGSSRSLLYHHMKQRHKPEFEEERRQKEAAKIRVTTSIESNDQVGQDKGDDN